MSRREVHLHIERLVLDGFAPGDRARIADGVERELRRLLADEVPTGWRRSCAVPRARATTITLSTPMAPERMGERIATAVYATGSKEEPR